MSNRKVYISLIRNPFDSQKRERWETDHIEGKPVAYYVQDIVFFRGIKLVGAINGLIVDDIYNAYPNPGDHIIVTAEIESGIEWGALILEAVITAVVVTAVSFAMRGLITALGLGPEEPDISSEVESSTTYGWGPLRQVETEGNPIPIIFGEHKVAGQTINKFITIEDDNKEYFNTVLAVNDGLVDSISDIRVNDQPVDNYRNITIYTRLGTLDDSPIPGFSKVVEHHSPDITTSTAGTTLQTDGNSVEEIGLIFNARRGIYHGNDHGGLDERYVDLHVQYRAVGTSSWTNYGRVRISGATTEAIRKSVTIEGLSPDQYEVSVLRTSGESTDWKTQDGVNWTGFKEIINDDLIYPGIAKYAIKALATDQLSGREPRLSCLVKRNTVSVYNPNTEAWETRNAQNPAWAAYSLLNEYHEIHHSRIVYSEFEDWANYCDEIVEEESRFRINIVLDDAANAWDNVQRIASLARARIVRRNTKYGVFVDKPESVVSHLFTMGNIISETFNMQYLPLKDRANAIEITYTDPDRDYSNQVINIFTDEYTNSSNLSNKMSVKIDATIRRSQAIREAAFRLNSNKYLVRTIEFEASVDSFDCVLGDLVYFQHLVPHYDEALGGRILDAGNDGENPYVQIEQEVELEAGTSYSVMVRLSSDDSLIEKSLQTVDTTHSTDTLLLSSDWSTIPEKYDLYVFGPADTYKKTYRVTNITRAQDLTRKITCMEYVPEIYNDTGYVIENPTWGEEVVQEAVQVSVNEFLTYSKAGDYASNIHVAWNANREDVGSNWDVYLIDETLSSIWEDGTFDESFQDVKNQPGIWHAGRTADMSFNIPPKHLVQGHQYTVAVCPAGQGLTATGANY